MSGQSNPHPPSEDEIRNFILDFFGGELKPFKPFAIYNKELGFFSVMIRDCSHTQIMVNNSLFIFEDNYPIEGEEKFIGFEIWATVGYCWHNDIICDDKVDLNVLLDAVVREFPNNIPEVLTCRQMLDKLESTLVRVS